MIYWNLIVTREEEKRWRRRLKAYLFAAATIGFITGVVLAEVV